MKDCQEHEMVKLISRSAYNSSSGNQFSRANVGRGKGKKMTKKKAVKKLKFSDLKIIA